MLMPSSTRVYVAPGSTDMRKAINGLSILVESRLRLDPFSGHLFVFCNRRRNNLKILYWDRNGFCLWQKRLEKDNFKWPQSEKQALEIDRRQLSWLLEGLDFQQASAHGALTYRVLA